MAAELNDVSILVRVVELGSFAKVARELSVPTSTVARAISRLEQYLRMRLIQRTTRSLSPTSEGRAFYQEVAPAVAAIQRASRRVADADPIPSGVLRVAASSEIVTWLLPRTIVRFIREYPTVTVDLELSARTVNLVEEGFDVAIRIGELDDSSLVASKLTELQASIYASPGYLEAHGTPHAFDELATHACVLHHARNGFLDWVVEGPEGRVKHTVRSTITSDDYGAIRAMVLEGAGIARLPHMLVLEDVQAGRLVRLFPDYASVRRSLHYMHESSRNVAPKMSIFRDLLRADLARREIAWRMLAESEPAAVGFADER